MSSVKSPYKPPIVGEASNPTVQPKSQPLTKTMHEALLALGQGAAVCQRSAMARRWSSGHLSEFDKILHEACYKAAEHMMLGQEYDIAMLFTAEGRRSSDSGIWSPTRSLDRARAEEVYKNAVGSPSWLVESYWERMSDDCKDQLVRNAQDLGWCNTVWSQFCTSGTVQADYVILFVLIFMAAMRLRCPMQDFPSQWSAIGTVRTLDELKVIHLSASIREKPEWRRKIQDDSIVSKWREEAYSQDVTPSMFDFLIAELQWFSDQYDPETGIEHATVPGVFASDNLISLDDCASLRAGANELAAIPERRKDWHPRSDKQVLDLVHPSLYPYVRGRTRRFLGNHHTHAVHPIVNPPVIPLDMDAMAAEILCFLNPPPPKNHISDPIAALAAAGQGVPTSESMLHPDIVELKWRNKSVYQWLPVDVDVSAGPDYACRFLSYVNNLHPAPNTPGGKLYPVLEHIFSQFIPLFERTLTTTRMRRVGNEAVRTEFLDESDNYWYIPKPTDEHPLKHEEELDHMDQLIEEWKEPCREFIRPVVKPFVPPGPPGESQVTLGSRRLQAIIKMANVHLTPEKPEYAGGSWHVEGTENECIVATGIYYFESENIGESSLSFRQAFDDPEYDQGEFEHLHYLYDIDNRSDDGEQANQVLGDVTTPEKRCICFPNGMQHRLSPFKLIDPTKPGHRKILVFFLVDPSMRILSTSDVPPQQLDWLLGQIRQQTGTRLSNLPQELFDLICEYVTAFAEVDASVDGGCGSPWAMSLAEAQEHRLKLMDERAAFVQLVNEEMYERGFSLCEH